MSSNTRRTQTSRFTTERQENLFLAILVLAFNSGKSEFVDPTLKEFFQLPFNFRTEETVFLAVRLVIVFPEIFVMVFNQFI